MYPEKLQKDNPYRYSNEDCFKSDLELVRSFVMDNYDIGLHLQEFFEINIVVRGSGMHYIGSNRIPAKCYDVFIIPPNTAHGYAGGDGFDVYHLLLSQDFMQKNFSDLQKLPSFFILFKAEPLMRTRSATPFHLVLTDDHFQKLGPLLSGIKEYTATRTASTATVSNALTMVLITQLCDIYTHNTRVSTPAQGQHDEAFAAALAMIYAHYNEKLSIAALAKTAQLSRSAFIQKFQNICKMSPARFITKQRLEAAEQLLLGTSLSVADIADRTGFYDTSHFIKAFTAETGKTPNAYRKEFTQTEYDSCTIT